MGITDKVERGVKARVDAVKASARREVDIGKTFVNDVFGLRPVKAVVDVTVETLDNIGDLIKRQAEITRELVR